MQTNYHQPLGFHGMQGMTIREFTLLEQVLHNEGLLAKLCAGGANQIHHPGLRQVLSSMARERLQLFDQGMMVMKQQTGFLH